MKHLPRLVLIVAAMSFASCQEATEPTRSFAPLASVAPPLVSGVTATKISDTRVDVSYTYAGTDSVKFRLWRRADSAGAAWESASQLKVTATRMISDSAFSSAYDAYWYALTSCALAGNPCSARSDSSRVSGLLLPAPTNLRLDSLPGYDQYGNGYFQAKVAWNDNSSNEVHFIITRTDTLGAQLHTFTWTPNSTYYWDGGYYSNDQLQELHSYLYTVQASLGKGHVSALSNVLRVNVPIFQERPNVWGPDSAQTKSVGNPAVGHINVYGSVTPHGLATTLWIQWSRSSNMSSPSETTHRSVGAGAARIAFTDSIMFPYTQGLFYFRIFASNSDGTVYTYTANVDFGRPRPPVGLSAALITGHKVVVGYDNNVARKPTKWKLFRRLPGALTWDSVTTGLGDYINAVTDSTFDVKPPTYAWMVEACNSVGCSIPSDSVLFASQMAAPTNLQITDTHAGHTVLQWTGGADATSFFVRRRGNAATFTTTNHTFIDTTTVAGLHYSYTIEGVASGPPTLARHSAGSNQVALTAVP